MKRLVKWVRQAIESDPELMGYAEKLCQGHGGWPHKVEPGAFCENCNHDVRLKNIRAHYLRVLDMCDSSDTMTAREKQQAWNAYYREEDMKQALREFVKFHGSIHPWTNSVCHNALDLPVSTTERAP